jgi:hypothetical protein
MTAQMILFLRFSSNTKSTLNGQMIPTYPSIADAATTTCVLR